MNESKKEKHYFSKEIITQVCFCGDLINFTAEEKGAQRNDLAPPLMDGMTFPRRKSKFLKMLKNYSRAKYRSSPDEAKSPAIEALEKAKKDLK